MIGICKTAAGQYSLYVSSVIDKDKKEVIIKIVNASDKEQINTFMLDGIKKVATQAEVTTLQNNDLNSENSFSNPRNVSPQESSVNVKSKKLNFTSMPYSFSVIKVKM